MDPSDKGFRSYFFFLVCGFYRVERALIQSHVNCRREPPPCFQCYGVFTAGSDLSFCSEESITVKVFPKILCGTVTTYKESKKGSSWFFRFLFKGVRPAF